MRRILCVLGVHKWSETTPAEFSDELSEKLWLCTKDATRRCASCNREEFLDRTLLGVNPPSYHDTWREKPAKITSISIYGDIIPR
jgi:hypothetical protein